MSSPYLPNAGKLCQSPRQCAHACRWAFSIWGLIFALQGLGIVYQLMPQGYTPDGWKQRIVNSVGAPPGLPLYC